jgi:hypothetical protein
VPCPYRRRRESLEAALSQEGFDVEAEQSLVKHPGPGPQFPTVLQPPRGVLSEPHLAQSRVPPGPIADLGSGPVEILLRSLLVANVLPRKRPEGSR